MNKNLIKELKKLCSEDPDIKTFKIKSLKDLEVELIDYTKNPYRTIFEMSLQTWGEPDKWIKASPQLRFEVVKKVLERKALPLALEAPYFAFQIKNISRAAFDQIARTRIGAVYAARGFKDNFLNYLDFIIPDKVAPVIRPRIKQWFKDTKILYKDIQIVNTPNWAARCVIPMYSVYNFMMIMHYATLQGFCGNRMETTEMEDTVGVAWLMREAVKKVFPLLAEYLRPNCDWKKRDTTADVNSFAEEMGIIHASDNRHPGFDRDKYDVRYYEPCTNINHLQKELKIKIPKPNEWKDYTWKTLKNRDKMKFYEN